MRNWVGEIRAWGREGKVGCWAADKLCREELTVGCCLDRSMAMGAGVLGMLLCRGTTWAGARGGLVCLGHLHAAHAWRKEGSYSWAMCTGLISSPFEGNSFAGLWWPVWSLIWALSLVGASWISLGRIEKAHGPYVHSNRM